MYYCHKKINEIQKSLIILFSLFPEKNNNVFLNFLVLCYKQNSFYLGKVILERLMETLHGIAKIYVLIRTKVKNNKYLQKI